MLIKKKEKGFFLSWFLSHLKWETGYCFYIYCLFGTGTHSPLLLIHTESTNIITQYFKKILSSCILLSSWSYTQNPKSNQTIFKKKYYLLHSPLLLIHRIHNHTHTIFQKILSSLIPTYTDSPQKKRKMSVKEYFQIHNIMFMISRLEIDISRSSSTQNTNNQKLSNWMSRNICQGAW